MNKYLENLKKIEFVVTYACTGKCKHCSEGDHSACGEYIDPDFAAKTVKIVASEYPVETVMTFGGEPLLYADAVYAIISAAKEIGVPKRQLITNGYFSNNAERVSHVAQRLSESGVNDLLISVDAFHQETIPLDTVKCFATEAKRQGIPIRISPAWLVSADDDNRYNQRTRELLDELSELCIPVGEGNVIFPEGNAKKYLAEYFKGDIPVNPYVEDPFDLRCLSFEPNGDVLGDNAYRRDIMEIIENYRPLH